MDRVRTAEVEDLLGAFLALETKDEAYALLVDLCTVREIHDMAQRLHVARMLAAGEHYAAIQAVTGASATTISRVSKALNYGADGYVRILARLPEAEDKAKTNKAKTIETD
ncbi:MAG: YerC/YecD family TrpR-related protein [Coriobacteriia bacterium]